jgi:hypothetical protein
MAEHLEGALGRFAANPEADEQARDECGVHLDCDTVFTVGQKVPTAQNALKPAEEKLSVPIIIPPKITLLSS